MTMLTLSTLILCSFSIIFNNSSMYIISIILSTITGAIFMTMNFNSIWLSFIILMLMVGGLMILYVFVLTMNSNENMKLKKNTSYLTLIILVPLFWMKMKSSKSNLSINSMLFQMNSTIILLIMLAILLTMLFSSKMIFNPSSPSKSFK